MTLLNGIVLLILIKLEVKNCDLQLAAQAPPSGQRGRAMASGQDGGPWRKRYHRDRGRTLVQAWGLAAQALPSGQGQALA